MTVTSGNFNYDSLVKTLKEEYKVKTADMNSVLEKIASKNNIDDIKNLDKSKTIQINIFGDDKNSTNPFDETLSAYNASIEQMMAKGAKLPEIYNDDEYEVSDYDDYYGFKDNTQSPNADKNEEEALDFEGFKQKYATSILDGPGNKDDQNEFLKQIFAQADTNSDNFLDKSELSGAFYAAEQLKQPNIFESDTRPKEEEDLLGKAMEMNMSSDSFNPQG